MCSCKQKTLLMNGQENVEASVTDQIEHEGQIANRIVPEARAPVEPRYEPRKAAQTEWAWITDLYVVPVESERGNGLSRRGAGAFGKKNAHALRLKL